ncbi:hypothetical protein FRB90_001532 [Tulasnella sp. 427]|nr:hypothetical protein FRB90_001532 [Tulasnella sp. 427]
MELQPEHIEPPASQNPAMTPEPEPSDSRAESAPVSRPSTASRPRLIPYIELPILRGGLASRGSTPALRASSVASGVNGTLKRKGSESAVEDTPLPKRIRKLRIIGPPTSLTERAQSLAATASTSSKFVRNTALRSVERQSSFKVPGLPAKLLRRPRRPSSVSSKEDASGDVSALPLTSDEEQPGESQSAIQVEEDVSEHEVEPSQLSDPSKAADERNVTPDATRTPRGRPKARPRTAPKSSGKSVKRATQTVKRRRGRPRKDGRDLVTVVQDGVESVARLRPDKKKRATRRNGGMDGGEDPSSAEDDASEDEYYQARGPTSRFVVPPAPITRPPSDRVPQDVLAAYASHSALLQSRTETGLPQLYAAFQTFWIPRRANYFILMGGAGGGLPYHTLTAQGGGPGSSTSVHLSNPSFFYWDPLPLVPGGVRCPAPGCTNVLHQAGLVKNPKRVFIEGNDVVSKDPYVGFWVVAAKYKCHRCGVRGTSNPKVYSSYVAWDQRILEQLPPLVRSEFPAVEKRRNGRKSLFAAELALPPEHRMDPQYVSTSIPAQSMQPRTDVNPAAAVPSQSLHQSHRAQTTGLQPPEPVDHPITSAPTQDSSAPASDQNTAREAEEVGEAAGRLFAELLFGLNQPSIEEDQDPVAPPEPGVGSSVAVERGDGVNADSGMEVEVVDDSQTVAVGERTSVRAESTVVEESVQAQSTVRPLSNARSSSSVNGGTTIVVAEATQVLHTANLAGTNLPLSFTSPPFETPSATPTPPVPSASTASASSVGVHPYYAQFKAPAEQVAPSPSIMFFNPFGAPGGGALVPSIPSWPPNLINAQPGSAAPSVSTYSTLAGAIVPTHDHSGHGHPPILPVPIAGSPEAKKRRGPRKCSKCLQVGCKGANGVQYCPNPCAGCRQVDCKKPHTTRGNLCVSGESGYRSTGVDLGGLVPMQPSPSNSDLANGNGEDVGMRDAEGEVEHAPDAVASRSSELVQN